MKSILILLVAVTGASALQLPRLEGLIGKLASDSLLHPQERRNDMQQSPWNLLPDRRAVLSNIALASALAVNSANAQDVNESTLEQRILDNTLSSPPYGMEAADIFYPSYFQGSWKASSKTTNVYAPCGFDLFPGGQSAFDNTVQKEIRGGDVLEYKARFVASSDDTAVIADREYNAKEIAKAAMGSFSVVDVSEATPNRFSCLLAPPEGSVGSLICVDILAIARKYEPISPTSRFVCSEVVRQIVSPASRSNPNAPPTSPLSVKEIETISVYTVENAETSAMKQINCKQRTAMFLVPSQTDPIAFKKWQMTRGQPVDVRYYDVTYSKL